MKLLHVLVRLMFLNLLVVSCVTTHQQQNASSSMEAGTTSIRTDSTWLHLAHRGGHRRLAAGIDNNDNNNNNTTSEWLDDSRLKVVAQRLFICRHLPDTCSRGRSTSKRLLLATMAAGKMNHDIWHGTGAWMLSLVGLLLFGVSMWISSKQQPSQTRSSVVGDHHSLEEEKELLLSDAEQKYRLHHRHTTVVKMSEIEDDDMVMAGRDDFENSPTTVDMSTKSSSNGKVKVGNITSAVFWNTYIACQRAALAYRPAAVPNHLHRRGKQDKTTFAGSSTQPQAQQRQQRMMRMMAMVKDSSSTAAIAASQEAIYHRIPSNVMRYWTGDYTMTTSCSSSSSALTFTEPLLTFKAFLVLLLFIELNDLMAPQQVVLATPEIVSLMKGAYPSHHWPVFYWAEALTLGKMNRENVDDWVKFFEMLRTMLLLSWFAFILIPKKHAFIGGFCYAIGAIIYCYLGVIGLMYTLSHSSQSAILFIFSAMFAVPFLETSKRANYWLRKFLYIVILNPIYLFAGISKFRYCGIIPNLTGSWLQKYFIESAPRKRVVLKTMSIFVANHAWMRFVFSWGNIVVEIILPAAIMVFTECWQLQLAFHGMEILFHLSIFLLLGPNFSRYCLMHVLAANPLGYVKGFAKHKIQQTSLLVPPAVQRQDWMRIIFSIVTLMGWWGVQFLSDILHILGIVPYNRHINLYFPFPELSMFADPLNSTMPNFGFSFLLTALSFIALIVDMMFRPTGHMFAGARRCHFIARAKMVPLTFWSANSDNTCRQQTTTGTLSFGSRQGLKSRRGSLPRYGRAFVILSAVVVLQALFTQIQISDIATIAKTAIQLDKRSIASNQGGGSHHHYTLQQKPSPKDFIPTKSQSKPESHLLNVPFYVYEELYWLEEGMVGNRTVQYYVEIVKSVKHTDDYWFAKAAMVHPKRTMDPSQAKLFIVPTLLNVITSQIANKKDPMCFQQMCNQELWRHADQYLQKSIWFQRNQGQDHLIVASHSGSERYIPNTLHIRQCNILVWGNRNYGFAENHNRVLLPKLYVGQACPALSTTGDDQNKKETDFALIASMHAERQTFASRRNICEWMKLENTNTTGHASSNTTMTSCGEGPQCPALANARFGFHVRGDTYGSNRLIDTLLSGTVPIFTLPEQYELLADWIDWKMLSYYANVSTQTTFLSDIRRIAADQQGYQEKHKHVVLNRDLFDWKTTIPFDTYMYMLSVHLWPALEWERRKTQNVSSPYTALILPKYDHAAAAAVGTSSGRNNTKEDDDDESHYSYLPFRAFDFQYKTVTCGGLFTPEVRSCQECPYTINAVKQVPRQRGSRLKSAYSSFLTLMSFSDYWTPSTPRTSSSSSSSSLALRGDPGGSGNGAAVEGGNAAFCSKSCQWTGTQCIHKTFPL